MENNLTESTQSIIQNYRDCNSIWRDLSGSSGALFRLGMVLTTKGYLAMSGDSFHFHNLGRNFTGNQWIKDKNIHNHPTTHKTSPTINKYMAQNINSAEIKISTTEKKK